MGVQQGATVTLKNITTTTVERVQVQTADVISAIGAAIGISFSPGAQLVVITPLPSGSVTIAIRDGGNSTDVSGFFAKSKLSGAVGSSTVNHKTGKSTGSDYGIQQFGLQDAVGYQPLALHYTLSGVAVEDFRSLRFRARAGK